MIELYTVFLIVGIILYLLIVAYSFWQKQKRKEVMSRPKGSEDPLFDKKNKAAPQVPTRSKATKPATSNVVESNDPKQLPKEPTVKPKESLGVRTSKTVEEQKSESSSDAAESTTRPSIAAELKKGNVNLSENEIVATHAIENTKPVITQESTATMLVAELETELVARIKNTKPLEQRELLMLFREYDYKFNRKVHLYGLNELTDLWRDIEYELPSSRFVTVGMSIQLVDRKGAISSKELHDFQQMALAFTEHFDAPFEFSMDVDETNEHASQLAKISERYDSMAVLNIVPRNKVGFRAADVESCARDLMMTMDSRGVFLTTRGKKQKTSILYRLACPDDAGHFGIKENSSSPVHDLVMYMNVPATETPEIIFKEMFVDANKLATWLDGRVVDRLGKVVTQRSYETLIKQIADIVYSMEAEGIVPGSSLSKKIF